LKEIRAGARPQPWQCPSAAWKFEAWVFEEVLPTIHKTGSYSAAPCRFSYFRHALARVVVRSLLEHILDRNGTREKMTTRTETGRAWSLQAQPRVLPSIKGEGAFVGIGMVVSAIALGVADAYPSLRWVGAVAVMANAAGAIALVRHSISRH